MSRDEAALRKGSALKRDHSILLTKVHFEILVEKSATRQAADIKSAFPIFKPQA